jgi:hypothetical protein
MDEIYPVVFCAHYIKHPLLSTKASGAMRSLNYRLFLA